MKIQHTKICGIQIKKCLKWNLYCGIQPNIKEEITLILLENGRGGSTSNLLYEASITLIPKSDKSSMRELHMIISYDHKYKNLQQNYADQIQK